MRVCGPAVTVHSPGGDNLWLHRALDVAQPGDVLVVYVSGAPELRLLGRDHGDRRPSVQQLGGLVLDGCVRDAALLEEMGFPVFSAGLCIRGTGKDHGARGWINHPIRMGDLTISAGDLIVGDRDGVVAVPLARVDEVVAASEARETKEALVLKRLVAGERTLEVYNF
jgi:4-hydroxy-4-methyl-2-oxoglutarate aldolase